MGTRGFPWSRTINGGGDPSGGTEVYADSVQELESYTAGAYGIVAGTVGIIRGTRHAFTALSADGSGSTWKPESGRWDLRDFGATGGADDWEAFAAAVARQQSLGGSVEFSEFFATYRLVAPAPLTITNKLRIVGSTEVELDFAGSLSDVFDLRAPLMMREVVARRWSGVADDRKLLNITEAPTQVAWIRLVDCDLGTAPDGWVLFCARQTAGAVDTAGLGQLYMQGTLIDGVAWGVQLDTYNLQNVRIEGCQFTNVEENAVWLGRDYAADLAAFLGQGDYVVDGCIFKNIGDGSVQSDPDRHAVIAFGNRLVVSACTISHVQNDTGTDCEAIYTKAINSVITGNTLWNAGFGQAAIAQKGLDRAALQTPGYNTVITGNVIASDGTLGASSAISLGVGEAIVSDNTIDGMNDTVLVAGNGVDGQFLDVLVSNNRIRRTSSNIVLSFNCPGGVVKVLGNTIDGITNGTGNAVGVLLSNTDTAAYQEVTIDGNTFRNFAGTGTHNCAVLDNMTQNPSVVSYNLTRNVCQGIVDGFKFAAVAPRPTRLRIEENDLVGCSGAGVAGAGVAAFLTANVRIRRNSGYLTENSGQVVFAATSTAVVAHGVQRFVRPERRINLEYVSTAPATPAAIQAAGATNFTIAFPAPHSGTVGWEILEHVEPVF